MSEFTNHPTHPTMMDVKKIKEVREDFSRTLEQFTNEIPVALKKAIDIHLHKLDAISFSLKNLDVSERPEWLTDKVIEEVKEKWDSKDNKGNSFRSRIDTVRMIIRVGEEAGFKVTLTDVVQLRERYMM